MPHVFHDIRNLIKGVDGFLTDREAWVLYKLAQRSHGGSIVEIGSWQGKSTIWLGLGTRSSRKLKLYAIDPHTGSEEHQQEGRKVWTLQKFEENIRTAGLEDLVVPIVDFAAHARQNFDQPVSLLFIDGAHDYASVKEDYDLWAPLVVDGGYVVFHDTQWDGVRKVCDEAFQKDGFRKVFFQDSICYGIKTSGASGVDRFRARCMVGLKNSFSAVCASPLSKSKRRIAKECIKFLRALLMIL